MGGLRARLKSRILSSMCGKQREDVREEDITGLKLFEKLVPLLKSLHDVGCERDKAGNRDLHYDQYCLLLLLFLFNPVVSSLRALQQASELKKVQRKLGCGRASLGSLSESTAVFDPELLKPIIEQLGSELRPIQNVGRWYVEDTLTAVDGSMLKTLSTITEAAYLKNCHNESKSAFRLHTHFYIDDYVPSRIDVTVGLNSGKTDEKNVLREVRRSAQSCSCTSMCCGSTCGASVQYGHLQGRSLTAQRGPCPLPTRRLS